jgi:CRISPR-associated protein Cmr2
MFYPTFFTQTGLEIINPHDRKTKVGKNPILFESVPQDEQGTFTLLYVPFDRVGQDPDWTRQELAEDLPVLVRGLQAMFCIYGFSAKRTSGFGLAEDGVTEGVLAFHPGVLAASQAAAQPVQAIPPQQPLPRYLAAPGRLKPKYLNADGTFRQRSEAELKAMKKSDRQEYDKAKRWWEREGQAQAESCPGQAEAAPPDAPSASRAIERDFRSFSELMTLAEQIAAELEGGAA